MAESMAEEGVSGERVMRAEAALRMEGEGWEGPGGGGAGMRRMLSMRRVVGERRSVRVGLVVEGGRQVRWRVGFGWGLEDSESVDVSAAIYRGRRRVEEYLNRRLNIRLWICPLALNSRTPAAPYFPPAIASSPSRLGPLLRARQTLPLLHPPSRTPHLDSASFPAAQLHPPACSAADP